MEYFEHMLLGFQTLLSLKGILILIAGVILGILGGALPGLSPSTTVALLVPFSYTLGPTLALAFLTSIYIASNYGGSITAILIKTPGTPAAAVTVFDGHALTQKGKASLALSHSLWASGLGGAIGIIILIFLAIPLASFALKLGPADYFSIAIFGLATVVSMGQGNMLKSLIAIVFGLLIKTIGMDPISGIGRFSFGLDELYDGINLIPVLIGLFAISSVIEKISISKSLKKITPDISDKYQFKLNELTKQFKTITSSSLIGTIIGVFPGAGATIASFISYDFAKRISKTPKKFGQGHLEGITASESANSASVGGALVPLLALGIPGSSTDAVLLGAFMLHDLTPGPLLFEDRPDIIYTIFVALALANLLIIFIGTIGKKFFLKIIHVDENILYPFILLLALMGSYSVNHSMFDMVCCFIFGIIGFLFKKNSIPVAPVVLGVVLGKMIEENFRRAVMTNGLFSFFESTPSLIILIFTLLTLFWPLYKKYKAKTAIKL